jgi:hypothetical protein
MVEGNYLLDVEHAPSGRKKTHELLEMILSSLDFKTAKIRIFNLLLKKLKDHQADRGTSTHLRAHNPETNRKASS